MRLFGSFILCLTLLASALAPAAIVSSNARPTLLITHAVDAAGSPQLSGKVGSLGFSSQGFGLIGEQIAPTTAAGLPQMPSLSLPTGATRELIVQRVQQWVAVNAPTLQSAFKTYMAQYGFSLGWYSFTQQIEVASTLGAQPMQLSWSMSIDASGRANYGVPRLDATGATQVRVLFVEYAAKSVPDSLSAAYVNPAAGVLRWQVLDGALNTLVGGSGSLDVAGAFDPVGDETSERAGVACVISASNPGCSDVGIDVRRLVQQSGASLALVDYTLPPEPLYTPIVDASCPGGAGQPCFGVQGSYQFTRRELSYANCGDDVNYLNQGSYGLQAQRITNRYLLNAELSSSTLVQRVTTPVEGTATAFNLTIPVSPAQAVELNTPSSERVINPHGGSTLITASQLLGSIGLADITLSGETSCPPVTAVASPLSHNVATVGLLSVAASGGKGPYTYRWQGSDVAGGAVSLSNPLGASTQVSRSGPSLGTTGGTVGFADVVVTDSRGTTATARVSLVIDADPPPVIPITISLASGLEAQTTAYLVYSIPPPVGPLPSPLAISAGSCNVSPSTLMCEAETQPAPFVVSGGRGPGTYRISWIPLGGTPATVVRANAPDTTFKRTAAPDFSGPLSGYWGRYRLFVEDVQGGISPASRDIVVETAHLSGCSFTSASVTLRNYSLSATSCGGGCSGGVFAAFVLNADGSVLGGTEPFTSLINERWLSVGGDASQYEILLTLQGDPRFHAGSLPLNTWSNLGAGLTFNASITGAGGLDNTWNYGFQIRRACDSTVLATGTLVIYLNHPFGNG